MPKRSRPTITDLYTLAEGHAGYFTTQQAAAVGYSPQALRKQMLAGRIVRVLHGIYRLVHFPAGEQEQLAILDLWANGEGVFSHETALAAYHLSDALPAVVHMTVPDAWRKRRLRTPPGLLLHFADLQVSDTTWFGIVHITNVYRTLLNCLADNVRPDLLRDAFAQAKQRGLLTAAEAERLAQREVFQ